MTTSSSGATSFHCPRCSRRFVVVAGPSVASPPLCSCGAILDVSPLASGIYEVRRSRRASRRRPARARPDAETSRTTTEPSEPDLGYGESHGYGPAHGGPTGPGDAPAPESPDKPDAT